MFDVHCHMLPGIDDGSKDVTMSLEMIRRSVEQGIEGLVFTPHFYADMNSPETFLKRRARALAELERRELVYSERTSGRFVTKDEGILNALHEDLAKKYFAEFSDKLRKIGMSDEEIAEAVKGWLEDIR